jgi:hypothetical protein
MALGQLLLLVLEALAAIHRLFNTTTLGHLLVQTI